MRAITITTIDQIPLEKIRKVTFYQRDEITTDLVCCDVETSGGTWLFNEGAEGWDLLLQHLQHLPGFRSDWHIEVAQPPFALNESVAYSREE
jgi:hypothetical protein